MLKARNTIKNTRKTQQEQLQRAAIKNRLIWAAISEANEIFKTWNSSLSGLTHEKADEMREKYGDNTIKKEQKESLAKEIFDAFINPFSAILIILAIVSFLTDVIFAGAGEKNPITAIIILTMIFISGTLRFFQESRSNHAAAKLNEMVKTTTCVERADIGKSEIPLNEVVVGDIIHLAAGDIIPADIRMIKTKDLFVSQSTLTGESEPVEKIAVTVQKENETPTDYPNLAFMGSTVISGSAVAVVVATGADTMLGNMAKLLIEPKVETSFDKGVNSISWLLIRFMLAMVPLIFVINGFTKGNWMTALLFAISIAVGLTPEMLPMIVTTCLAKGAVSMGKKKTIIKNLSTIQNFGAMDILCTDKTGTITQDKVVLEYYLDVHGHSDERILRHAFLNSYYQTGLKNLIDIAIINHAQDQSIKELATSYEKIDEIPFDFSRRRMSVVVADKNGKTQMITKGAVEEMLSISAYAEYKGQVVVLTDEVKQDILKTVDKLNDEGMRVIAVAQKTNPSPVGAFTIADEDNMVLMGYLAFLDPPKTTTAQAIEALKNYGVATKILTGDNDRVTRCICRQVGIQVDHLLLGNEVEAMSDAELSLAVERTNVFAKLSPEQKVRIVAMLRDNGHTVGFMGDGINDAAAMKTADVGVSVDTAVDIAKESADIILLEKDLMVLEEGIIEGRKTYANMMKYIRMTASSNFGNVFSILVSSIFLPFLPMTSVQIILLNLIYDISCIAIPWDNVDEEVILKPRKWEASSIGSFMLWFGPISSIFDITTYFLMFFVISPAICGGQLYHQITDPATKVLFISTFQAGWFVESMWTQTMVIHMIRTPKIPFIQSRASLSVITLTLIGIISLTVIPFTKLGSLFGLSHLPIIYFAWLILTITSYMVLVTAIKSKYIKKYGML